MGISIPSAEEYEANRSESLPDFTLLPEDDYIVEIKDVEVRKDQVDIYNKNPDGSQRVRDTLLVRLRPISFLDGTALLDENGDEVGDDRLFFAFIDPTHVGLVPQPAKARKFFAAAIGVAVDDAINIDSYSDLVGKRIVVSVVHDVSKKTNKKQHKVIDFRRISRRGTRAKAADTDVAVAAESKLAPAVDLTKAAADIFDDDLPF